MKVGYLSGRGGLVEESGERRHGDEKGQRVYWKQGAIQYGGIPESVKRWRAEEAGKVSGLVWVRTQLPLKASWWATSRGQTDKKGAEVGLFCLVLVVHVTLGAGR